MAVLKSVPGTLPETGDIKCGTEAYFFSQLELLAEVVRREEEADKDFFIRKRNAINIARPLAVEAASFYHQARSQYKKALEGAYSEDNVPSVLINKNLHSIAGKISEYFVKLGTVKLYPELMDNNSPVDLKAEYINSMNILLTESVSSTREILKKVSLKENR